MGEYHGIQITGIELKVLVSAITFFTPPLVQAAVQQEFRSVHLDQVLAARHSMSSAVEDDKHISHPPR
jgi:hypothetical protein